MKTTLNKIHVNNSHLSLTARTNNSGTDMVFNIKNKNYLTTKELPLTIETLKENYPIVLKTECGNDSELPFDQEVLNTEIAHLFEHILIQKLADLRLETSGVKQSYSGVTEWDWEIYPVGSFKVTITAKEADLDILERAIQESAEITSKILACTR